MSYNVILSRFTTCDIADGLLNLYNISNGGFLPNLQRFSGEPKGTVVGPAYTVLFESVKKTSQEVNYIDNVPKGSVLVIALPVELQLPTAPYVKITQAMYGGLMSTRAQYLGANGTVVFGRIRDVGEHRELNHPVFSYGLGVCAPKMSVKPSIIGEPLPILSSDGTQENICSGDYIVADENGVVRIPKDIVDMERLINYIQKSIEADSLVFKDIKDGVPAKQAQKKHRAALKELLD
ncbi:bifunctional 4-hydroxy-4-methyl-2-oxoglutarate aldolase/oxaloacetate decarboxylase Ecym_4468 [Eremothecium cymbalariae DBVPG|uniref:4-hydroxy-4-methyl-2-oxoglutarate aldolase n=1 Tax=Eremothecium cymbalariae (strain CBS 270.75 / DBVPG 7215 / KCTC 17166 / NRRL Y-17582) TaxID=931890 RepID=G8JU05_ERECY|nr:hypothetical protein Ecym_4468 [Eremothecium cymbalariae DBVPG\